MLQSYTFEMGMRSLPAKMVTLLKCNGRIRSENGNSFEIRGKMRVFALPYPASRARTFFSCGNLVFTVENAV